MIIFRESFGRKRAAHEQGFRPPKIRGANIVLAILFSLPIAACQDRVAQIDVNSAVRYQTMTGWEGAVSAPEPGDKSFPYYVDTIIERAVNEVGINRVRLEIRGGAENAKVTWSDFVSGAIAYPTWRANRYATINDNDDPMAINWEGYDFSEVDSSIESFVIPVRELLRKRGEELFINVCYVAFTGQIKGGSYIHDDPDEYAELVLATYLHMKDKYGIVPDAWEVILEPDNVVQWNGETIGRAMVAAAKRLKAEGFEPRFIAPSVTNMANAAPYFDQIIEVDGAIQYLAEFSYHRYSGLSPENLRGITDRAEKFGVDTSMLEWWFGNGTYHVLHEDVKVGRNSAWQGRTISGLFDIDKTDPTRPIVTLAEDTRYNVQYYRQIRAGAQRIEAQSSSERSFDPVAFINPDGTYVVVIKALSQGEFTITGLPAGTYGSSYATEEGSVKREEVQTLEAGKALLTSIPGAGVVTVYATGPRNN